MGAKTYPSLGTWVGLRYLRGMEAHIRYAASVAPVLEGLVKAGLIEIINQEAPKPANLHAEEAEARVQRLKEAMRVLAQNPNLY